MFERVTDPARRDAGTALFISNLETMATSIARLTRTSEPSLQQDRRSAGTVARREAVSPGAAEHLLSLQRAAGNRAVVAGLAAGQAKLVVAHARDANEHDEDVLALSKNKTKDLADPHAKAMAVKPYWERWEHMRHDFDSLRKGYHDCEPFARRWVKRTKALVRALVDYCSAEVGSAEEAEALLDCRQRVDEMDWARKIDAKMTPPGPASEALATLDHEWAGLTAFLDLIG